MIFFDTESSSLDANLGALVAVGMVFSDGREKFLFADSFGDEKKVITDTMDILLSNRNEPLVIWYSPFDIPFFVTRAIKNGIDVSQIYDLQVIDLCKLVQDNLKLSSNKLDEVSKFLGIEKNLNVTGADVNYLYSNAVTGNEESKRKIIDHCRDDILAMKKISEKLEPYVKVWLNRRNSRFK